MKAIIAATDFSPVSMDAVNYAADMAIALNAELIVLNVYNITVSYNDGTIITTPIEELRDASEKGLDNIKDILLSRTENKIRLSVKARQGNVTEELEDLCKSIQPFAVVIGSRGKTNLEKTVFGSAAFSIIKHVTWPVICVPPGKEYGSGIRKIGFACDFEDVDETTPETLIKQFIHEYKAEFHILNVGPRVEAIKHEPPMEWYILYQMFLNERPNYHYIRETDIEKGIISFTEANKLDLVIAIPKKHNLIEKIFHPSNTRHLLSNSKVPIMCIHQ